jgi:hypothetical protein
VAGFDAIELVCDLLVTAYAEHGRISSPATVFKLRAASQS